MLPGYPALHSGYPCCLVPDLFKAPSNPAPSRPSFSIDSILAKESGRIGTVSAPVAGPSTTIWTASPLHYHYSGAELCGKRINIFKIVEYYCLRVSHLLFTFYLYAVAHRSQFLYILLMQYIYKAHSINNRKKLIKGKSKIM